MQSNDQSASGIQTSNRVVMFADMLGFSALTEANPIEFQKLHNLSRPLSLSVDDILSQNPLTKAFSRFHYSLKWAIMMAEMRHALTAITFSDSVFIATAYLFEAA